ncbi:unnamed protein product [Acanthosepion pharaonis]|uniref:Uncharacterized protein n=1 Tax=Acanthosepion pharaonis TaxID=158019 RepID=A0A812DYK8_ACAPH|nr:unnamed protein product [Sepia pharaonis]
MLLFPHPLFAGFNQDGPHFGLFLGFRHLFLSPLQLRLFHCTFRAKGILLSLLVTRALLHFAILRSFPKRSFSFSTSNRFPFASAQVSFASFPSRHLLLPDRSISFVSFARSAGFFRRHYIFNHLLFELRVVNCVALGLMNQLIKIFNFLLLFLLAFIRLRQGILSIGFDISFQYEKIFCLFSLQILPLNKLFLLETFSLLVFCGILRLFAALCPLEFGHCL